MKKTLLNIALMIMSVFGANAQGFFEPTTYIGALGSDTTKDWTKGWTNFEPKTTVYPVTTDNTTLDGASATNGTLNITSNLTLDSSKVYKLTGMVVVKSGATLTIPAGTIIRGIAQKTNFNYAVLIIDKGAKINITGTKTKPVIMTSNEPVGNNRIPGNWGGLVLLGNAVNNTGNANLQLEGFNSITANPNEGKHGGNNDLDNSGSIKYLRIEFAGIDLAINQEINSLTFGSVGSGTTIDYVQASWGGDDAFEWFGGTVNAKHLIAFATADDDFDTDFGYRGFVQYGIGVKVSGNYDLTYGASSGSSTSEGFESDNDATGTSNTPRTAPRFSNMTMIGIIAPGTNYSSLSTLEKAAYRRGARFRRNSEITVINSIFMGYRNFLMVDGNASMSNFGIVSGSANDYNNVKSFFRNNLIVDTASSLSPNAVNANGLVESFATATGMTISEKNNFASLNTYISDTSQQNKINPVSHISGAVLVDPKGATKYNFNQVSTSPGLSGSNFTYTSFYPVLTLGLNPFVSKTSEIENISLYPNPTSGIINIDLEITKPSSITIKVTNMVGSEVSKYSTEATEVGGFSTKVELNNQPKGLYVVTIISNSGVISKVVKVQ